MLSTDTPLDHGEIRCKDCGKQTYMVAATKTHPDGRQEHICYVCFYGPVLTGVSNG